MTEPEPLGSMLQRRAEQLRDRIATGTDPTPEEMAAEREEHRRRWLESTRESNLAHFDRECPKRFAGVQFAEVDDTYRDALTDWANDPKGRNLLLAGNVGSGKTHTALATARFMLGAADDHIGLQVVTVVTLLDMLRPGYVPEPLHPDSPWDSGPDPMRRACTVDLLVLDDIGVEKGTEWVSERLSEIIDTRWRECRPTIATTNLTLGRGKELETVVGERAYSRLVGSDAVVIRMAGADRRRG